MIFYELVDCELNGRGRFYTLWSEWIQVKFRPFVAPFRNFYRERRFATSHKKCFGISN
jgi:hypothetical protein